MVINDQTSRRREVLQFLTITLRTLFAQSKKPSIQITYPPPIDTSVSIDSQKTE